MIEKLTRKQERFLDAYIQGKPLWECAKLAGSKGKDNSVMNSTGFKMLRALNLTMADLMDRRGLTEEKVLETIEDGMRADKHILTSDAGKFTDERIVPDHQARAKFSELYGKFRQSFVEKKELVGKDGGDIILKVEIPRGSKGVDTLEID